MLQAENQEVIVSCETCLGKVEHSKASDCSIFQREPEQDHLVMLEVLNYCILPFF